MKVKFFRNVNDCKALQPKELEKDVNLFLAELEEKGSHILLVEYGTNVVKGSCISEYRVITTCVVTYEEKKQEKGYDPYWDENPNNRMLRLQMYQREVERLEKEGVANAGAVAWDIVNSHEWPPENE